MTEALKGWDNNKRPVQRGYPPESVQLHCVRNQEWQQTRLSLKGLPTHEKLARLEKYWDDWHFILSADQHYANKIKVQVGNYLGALRRGGQLDANNQIKKYI